MKSFFEVGCGAGFVLSAVSSAFPSAKIAGSGIFSEVYLLHRLVYRRDY